jgi:hypothetical protein
MTRTAVHTDAADFGFTPEGGGLANAQALQRAVDRAGSIAVTRPGTYDIAATVYVGPRTSLVFGNGVVLRKVPERGNFAHVLLNKGALTKTYDEAISIEGLRLQVNGVDKAMGEIYGLRGQIAFFYVRDLHIERFRCDDLARTQFAIHVCTFEDLAIEDVIIRGGKDGIHLGRGRRFSIRRGVFQTHDDAVALNAHDYATSNPELGWIEDGMVEDCHDLAEAEGTRPVGYFCRMLAGAWTDWHAGMEVQHSDTVISSGRLYRVQARPDGTVYTSATRPTHTRGAQVLDGFNWGLVQDESIHTAGVRNVTFRDIFLHNPRTSFSVHFDRDRHSRSYYPGALVPVQRQIRLDGVRVLHEGPAPLVEVKTPVDCVALSQCHFGRGGIIFRDRSGLSNYGRTVLSMTGCTFTAAGEMELVTNEVPGKRIVLNTAAGETTSPSFHAKIKTGGGEVAVRSDLPGLA